MRATYSSDVGQNVMLWCRFTVETQASVDTTLDERHCLGPSISHIYEKSEYELDILQSNCISVCYSLQYISLRKATNPINIMLCNSHWSTVHLKIQTLH